jgi:hypothetical protein
VIIPFTTGTLISTLRITFLLVTTQFRRRFIRYNYKFRFGKVEKKAIEKSREKSRGKSREKAKKKTADNSKKLS